MNKYNLKPVRYVTRIPFLCDNCHNEVPVGARRCSIGQYKSCKDCEHTLAAKQAVWYDGHAERFRKLTNEQATEVRRLYAAGQHTYAQLAEMFGVNATTIGDIARGRRYQDAI